MGAGPPLAQVQPTRKQRGMTRAAVLLYNGGGGDKPVLPLKAGGKIAVVGPHAKAQRSLIQVDTEAVCDVQGNFGCLETLLDAITRLNVGGTTTTARGCDSVNGSTAMFGEAMEVAKEADIIVAAMWIRSCGGAEPGETVDGTPTVPDPDFSRCHGYHTTFINGDQHLRLRGTTGAQSTCRPPSTRCSPSSSH